MDDGLHTHSNEPIAYSARQLELAKKFDTYYSKSAVGPLRPKPSEILLSAIYVIHRNDANNADWLSQAAHSLRELLYPIYSSSGMDEQVRIERFKEYGYPFAKDIYDNLGVIYGKLSNLAHHGSNSVNVDNNDILNFDQKDLLGLLDEFESLSYMALSTMLDVHGEIDDIVSKHPSDLVRDVTIAEINRLVKVDSSKDYFFHRADARWLDFLWKNGFLDAIKELAKDSTRMSMRMPELSYLYRMTSKDPQKVTDIVLDTPISESTLNPEVIAWFLRITAELPAGQVARVVKKIYEDKWPKLMGLFNDHGFDYAKMFEVLYEAKDYDSVILLAKVVLQTKSKGELKKANEYLIDESPFYFRELSYIKVLKYLLKVPDEYVKQALELVVTTFGSVVKLFSDPGSEFDDYPFEYDDKYLLADVDFFKLKFGDSESVSIRKDIESLAAVAKELVVRKPKECYEIIGKTCKSKNGTIALSKSMWQLWLYTLSLDAKSCRDEVVKTLNEIYAGYDFLAISSGAEYITLLGRTFELFTNDEQREYVANGLKLFNPKNDEGTDRHSHEYKGRDVFFAIRDYLTKEELSAIDGSGINVNEGTEPTPVVGPVTTGMVTPKPPIGYDDFAKLPIKEIVDRLKDKWSPDGLYSEYGEGTLFAPVNAEGVGDIIRQNMRERFQEYISNAVLFFDVDDLSSHYTYSLLRGVSEEISANRDGCAEVDWSGLFDLFNNMKDYGDDQKHYFPEADKDNYRRGYLANWTEVHKKIAKLMSDLLRIENDVSIVKFDERRAEIMEILKYLLKNKDLEPKDESIDDAKSMTSSQGQDYKVSNPYMTAINSVRGTAFEAFVLFIYRDGGKLAGDAKDVYNDVLMAENTRALYFLFGRYLATIYYRDEKWTVGQLFKMFPLDKDKKYMYLAAWEGYLSNNLYRELFDEPKLKKLYDDGITKTTNGDIDREFYRDPEEGLAIHLALAYVNYDNFGLDDKLFRKFWFGDSPKKRRGHFIKFIGQKYISEHGDLEDTVGDNDKVSKLRQFWEWALDEGATNTPESSFVEFSSWMKNGARMFGAEWLAKQIRVTLEKSQMKPDLDYNLLQVIDELAGASPEDTLEILRMDLLEYGVRRENKNRHMFYEENWKTALEKIYTHKELQQPVKELINDLIAEGGSQFWILKDVLN